MVSRRPSRDAVTRCVGEAPFGQCAGRACRERAVGNLKLSDGTNITAPGLLKHSGALPPSVRGVVLHKKGK